MRRCRIPSNNIVSLLHGIAFTPCHTPAEFKSNRYLISLGDTGVRVTSTV